MGCPGHECECGVGDGTHSAVEAVDVADFSLNVAQCFEQPPVALVVLRACSQLGNGPNLDDVGGLWIGTDGDPEARRPLILGRSDDDDVASQVRFEFRDSGSIERVERRWFDLELTVTFYSTQGFQHGATNFLAYC